MKWVRRVLVVLVGLPLVGLLGLFLAGRREGAGRTSSQVDIARPPGQVFKHLDDVKLVKKWTGLAEVTRLTEGSLGPGTRLRMVAEARGQRNGFVAEVTVVEKDRRLVVVLTSAPGSAVSFREIVDYRLESHDGSTRLGASSDTHYIGLLPRLLEPFLTSAGQKRLDANLSRLKAQVEAEAAAPQHAVVNPLSHDKP